MLTAHATFALRMQQNRITVTNVADQKMNLHRVSTVPRYQLGHTWRTTNPKKFYNSELKIPNEFRQRRSEMRQCKLEICSTCPARGLSPRRDWVLDSRGLRAL